MMWTTRGWRISGWRWKTFAKNLWTKVNTGDVLNRAAILSFYFLLALFPLLLFLTALLGYFANPGTELRRNLLTYLKQSSLRFNLWFDISGLAHRRQVSLSVTFSLVFC